jgi:type IX secretion system substrate protein
LLKILKMKYISLLLATCCITINIVAQEFRMPIMQGLGSPLQGGHEINLSNLQNEIITKHMAAGHRGAAKTTALGIGRWYDYSVYWQLNFAALRLIGGSEYIFDYGQVIWKDTFCIQYYSSGPGYINLTSMATILEPQFVGFDDAALWDPILGAGDYIEVRPGDNYLVDSFLIPNEYVPGNKAATTTDTLRVCFLYGKGGTLSTDDISSPVSHLGGHYAGVSFLEIGWDSVTNCATSTSSTPTAWYMDVLIANTDTSSLLANIKPYQIVQNGAGGGMAHKGVIRFSDGSVVSGSATPYPVPAGNYVACAYTFISGDPATHGAGKLAAWPGDTLFGAIAPFDRYNNFSGIIAYWESEIDPKTFTPGDKLPTPDFPAYSPIDFNTGLFNRIYHPGLSIGGGKYYYDPQWDIYDSLGRAFPLQDVDVSFHIVCPTCPAVPEKTDFVSVANSVYAYPNPATEELNISFDLSQKTNATASLTNILGQEMAMKQLNNTAKGNIVFDTKSLPGGVYIYRLQAGTEFYTGRIVITH